jgi:hypothetical protein
MTPSVQVISLVDILPGSCDSRPGNGCGSESSAPSQSVKMTVSQAINFSECVVMRSKIASNLTWLPGCPSAGDLMSSLSKGEP